MLSEKITVVLFFQGNHFDQYEEGHLEIEQASLDKPIESVRSVLNFGSQIGSVRVTLDVNEVKLINNL